jgi:hypothetical protein
MTRRRLILCNLAFSVLTCAGLLAFAALPALRRAIAEPIVGEAHVRGTMHINTPIEDIHR